MKKKSIFVLFLLAAILVFAGLTGCMGTPEPPYEPADETVTSDYPPEPPNYEAIEDDEEYIAENADGYLWGTEELALFINNFLTHGDIFTPENSFWGTVLVMRGDEIVIHRAYGLACAEQNIENTLDTAFEIASITKQITGAAIIQLIADGKLSPDDTLDMFFDSHNGLENVTVAHLLTMRGGFGNFLDYLNPILASPQDSLLLFQELLDSLPEEDSLLVLDRLQSAGGNILAVLGELQELESIRSFIINYLENLILTGWSGEPLNRSQYSNSDYWLLGRIIEHVSGMTYEEFIRTRIFEPVGMLNSGFRNVPGTAFGHDADKNTMFQMPFAVAYATGGLTSTTGDLSLWLDAYFSGKLFPEAMLEQVFTVSGGYNCGWQFATDSVWWHSGGASGFSNMLIYDRHNDIRMIVLSNWSNGQLLRINREISARVFNMRMSLIHI